MTLGWFLKDEQDRTYTLAMLAGLKENEAIVPFLWAYEVSNGLVMAHRRKRVTSSDLKEILASLMELPIIVDQPEVGSVLELPALRFNIN